MGDEGVGYMSKRGDISMIHSSRSERGAEGERWSGTN